LDALIPEELRDLVGEVVSVVLIEIQALGRHVGGCARYVVSDRYGNSAAVQLMSHVVAVVT
jgi:hypothetical protein